jgi:hypothetical protein
VGDEHAQPHGRACSSNQKYRKNGDATSAGELRQAGDAKVQRVTTTAGYVASSAILAMVDA